MSFFPVTHKADVYRFVVDRGKETYDTAPVYTDRSVTIQPAGPQTLTIYPGIAAYQAYDIFIYDPIVIKNGDKFISGMNEWIVKGVPEIVDMPYVYYQKIAAEKVI